MGKFLHTYDLQSFNQEDANNENRFIMGNKIEAIVGFFQKKMKD